MSLALLSKDDVPLAQISERLTSAGVPDISCLAVGAFLGGRASIDNSDLVILICSTPDVIKAGEYIKYVRERLGDGQRLVVCMPRAPERHLLRDSGVDEIISPAGQSLERVVERILGHVILAKQIAPYSFESMRGATPEMRELYKKIEKFAALDPSVLLLGATGTGKGLVAAALHARSARVGRHMVINCASIPADLIASELFGHAKGTFTNAIKDRKGQIEEAQDGSVFFDEIGDLGLPLQAALLDVVEYKRVMPVGTNDYKDINARFVFATHCDLDLLIRNNRFREDLFERINQLDIVLPPLSQRMADIPLLVEHFLAEFNETNHKSVEVDAEAVDELFHHAWGRNVRELLNVVRKAAADAGENGKITDIMFRESIRNGKGPSSGLFRARQSSNEFELDPRTETWPGARDRLEGEYFKLLLVRTKGNNDEMVKLSGLSRSQVFELIRKHGLSPKSRSLNTASDSQNPESQN